MIPIPLKNDKSVKAQIIRGFYYLFLIFLVLFVVVYLPFFGWSYPPCVEREKALDIPVEYQGAIIQFQVDQRTGTTTLHKAKGIYNFGGNCSNTVKKSDELYISLDDNKKLVTPEDKFKLVKILNISCPTLYCIDRLSNTTVIILEDEQGQIYTLRDYDLEELKPEYYKNEILQGTFTLCGYQGKLKGYHLIGCN